MQIGDICRVNTIMSHKPSQQNDLVLLTRTFGSVYVEGINLRTNTTHHYLRTELEVINE